MNIEEERALARLSAYLQRFLPREESSFEERMPGITQFTDSLKKFKGGEGAVKRLLDLCRSHEFFGNVQNSQMEACGTIFGRCRDIREKYCRPGQAEVELTVAELVSVLSFLVNAPVAIDTARCTFYYSHYVYLLIQDTFSHLIEEASIELHRAQKTGEFDSKDPLQKFEEMLYWLDSTIAKLPEQCSDVGRDFYLREFIYTMDLGIEMPLPPSGTAGRLTSPGPHCRKRTPQIFLVKSKKKRGERLSRTEELLLGADEIFGKELERAIRNTRSIFKVTEEVETEDELKAPESQMSYAELIARLAASLEEKEGKPEKQQAPAAPAEKRKEDGMEAKKSARPAVKVPHKSADSPSATFEALDVPTEVQQMMIYITNNGMRYPLGREFGELLGYANLLTTCLSVISSPQAIISAKDRFDDNKLAAIGLIGFTFAVAKNFSKTHNLVTKKSLEAKRKSHAHEITSFLQKKDRLSPEEEVSLAKARTQLEETRAQTNSFDYFQGMMSRVTESIGDLTPGVNNGQQGREFGMNSFTGSAMVRNLLSANTVAILARLGFRENVKMMGINAQTNSLNEMIGVLNTMIPEVVQSPDKNMAKIFVVSVEEFMRAKQAFGRGGSGKIPDDVMQRFSRMFRTMDSGNFLRVTKGMGRDPQFQNILKKRVFLPMGILSETILNPTETLKKDMKTLLKEVHTVDTQKVAENFSADQLISFSRILSAFSNWGGAAQTIFHFGVASYIIGSPFFDDYISDDSGATPYFVGFATFSLFAVIVMNLYWCIACRTTLHPTLHNGAVKKLILTEIVAQGLGYNVSVTNSMFSPANNIVDGGAYDLLGSFLLEGESWIRNRSGFTKTMLLIAKFVVGESIKIAALCAFSCVLGGISQGRLTTASVTVFDTEPDAGIGAGIDVLPLAAIMVARPATLICMVLASTLTRRVVTTHAKIDADPKILDDSFGAISTAKNVTDSDLKNATQSLGNQLLEIDVVVSGQGEWMSVYSLLCRIGRRFCLGNEVYEMEASTDSRGIMGKVFERVFTKQHFGIAQHVTPDYNKRFNSKSRGDLLNTSAIAPKEASKRDSPLKEPANLLLNAMLQRCLPSVRVIGMIVNPAYNDEKGVGNFIRTYECENTKGGSGPEAVAAERCADIEDAFWQLMSIRHKKLPGVALLGRMRMGQYFGEEGELKVKKITCIDHKLPCFANRSTSSCAITLYVVQASSQHVSDETTSPLYKILRTIEGNENSVMLAYCLENV